MLSARLSEELDEEEDYDDNMIDELFEMEIDEEDEDNLIDEEYYDEDEEVDLSEEIDLEEILNELGLEEGMVCEMCGTTHEGSCPGTQAMMEKKEEEENINENFDLDLLLEKINNLSEEEEIEDLDEEIDLELEDDISEGKGKDHDNDGDVDEDDYLAARDKAIKKNIKESTQPKSYNPLNDQLKISQKELIKTRKELSETKTTLNKIKSELNEVNVLNSKLLYVNRIFKANTLDEGQKLRVVETLDKAETAKEAKLIYETIKDTFNVAKSKKASFKNKTKSLKEGIGMASKTSGTTQSNARKEVISESNDMMKRFQKLANIKIN